MASQRTIEVKKKRNLFAALSYGLFIATSLFLSIYVFIKVGDGSILSKNPDGVQIFTDQAVKAMIGFGVTVCIGICGTIILKDTLRTFIWMASLVMASLLFGTAGMYIVLSIWLIDEYVFHKLYKYYSNKLTINKEIDLREQ